MTQLWWAGAAAAALFVVVVVLAFLLIRARGGFRPWLREYMSQQATMGLPWLGYRIFKWLLGLAVLLIVALFAYGWQTYPTLARLGGAGQVSLEALATAQDAWLAQMKDLIQLLVLTPIVPLIGAVIGYIFGRQPTEAEQQRMLEVIARGGPATAATAPDDTGGTGRGNADPEENSKDEHAN